MKINENYYDNNPISELNIHFKNFTGTELEEDMTFLLDMRSLHCVGMDSFCRWKLNMSEEDAKKQYDFSYSSWDDDRHCSAEYYIDEKGNWYDKQHKS